MQHNGLFACVAEQESETGTIESLIVKIMQEHFHSTQPVVMEEKGQTRTYRLNDFSVKIHCEIGVVTCDFEDVFHWNRIAYEDYLTNEELYKKLITHGRCELYRPLMSDYQKLNPDILTDFLHDRRLLEKMIALQPELSNQAALADLLDNNTGSYSAHSEVTWELIELFLDAEQKVGRSIREVVNEHLSKVHPKLYFDHRPGFIGYEYEHHYLKKEFVVSIANALRDASLEIANNFANVVYQHFLDDLIGWASAQQVTKRFTP